MNGAFGDDRYGFVSTLRTDTVASRKPSASACALTSSSAATLSLGLPSAPKSLPVATFVPSTATSRAVNAGDVAALRSIDQYPAEMNAMRSRSR